MFILKKLLALIATSILIFIGYVTISIHHWSITDEGRLPPKTAVLLYAINNNLVTSDTKPPKFLSKPRPSTIAKEDILLTVANGEEILGRVYYPKNEGPHPVILYYHGGAFMEGYGNIETHDNIIRALAVRTNSVVIAVSYRVAPQYVFPTAVEDSYNAFLWAYENVYQYNGDPKRIAVVGDSAGGNLATAVTLMAKDLGGPNIIGQALLYPLTTFQDIPLQSRRIYDSGYYLLSRSVMYQARELYTPKEEMWASPYTSPLNAKDLAGLPATLIITAEFDPLKDEGQLYAKRLAEYGVPVHHLHYHGVMHGFISFYEVMNLGNHGLMEVISFLNSVFSMEEQVGYVEKTVKATWGTKEFKEYIEAYGIAIYLIYQQIIK